jgi:hypothetical protein
LLESKLNKKFSKTGKEEFPPVTPLINCNAFNNSPLETINFIYEFFLNVYKISFFRSKSNLFLFLFFNFWGLILV